MRHSIPLVKSLLERGDVLEIVNGRLNIIASSGISVPRSWLKEYATNLVLELVAQLTIDTYIYDSYTTGRYGAKRYSGVCLQFINLLSGESAYIIFNADLDRVKTTAKGRKGSPLPNGQFRVGKRSEFYKFWNRVGQKLPPRLSSFHDYMGNLKGAFYTASVADSEKLEKQSLSLLDITSAQISSAFSKNSVTYDQHTKTIQEPNKSHTATPYNDYVENHTHRGLPSIPSTGHYDYGRRLIGSAEVRSEVMPIINAKKPEEQTVDEWIADYCNRTG